MNRATRVARRPRPVRALGLAPRLFLSFLLVIVAGAGTVLALALLAGPEVFRFGLAGTELPASSEVENVADAFEQALLFSLGTGVLLAVAVAAAISWLVARRVAAPIQAVAAANRRLCEGERDIQLEDPQLGPELRSLTDSTNQLARRLDISDTDRRRLTRDLAHQLRTPIASLQATTQALQDHILPADQATLDVLADQATRLHRLVNDLERVTRAEERRILITPTPQPLPPLIEKVVAAQHDRYHTRGVTLRIEADTGHIPAVRIDPDRIHEAVTNVLDNALRHTPPGGHVTVRLTGSPQAACVEVIDTGEGFDPTHVEAIFERFHREPAAHCGTGSGLGLTIARALLEAHHGTLTGHSAGLGRGAKFTLTLPAEP